MLASSAEVLLLLLGPPVALAALSAASFGRDVICSSSTAYASKSPKNTKKGEKHYLCLKQKQKQKNILMLANNIRAIVHEEHTNVPHTDKPLNNIKKNKNKIIF